MALTRQFKQTIMARVQRDPAFRMAMLIEAINEFLAGDIEIAKRLLRTCSRGEKISQKNQVWTDISNFQK